MAAVTPLQSSFNAGEVSPLIYARSDVAKYKNGLTVCLNSIPLIQGGWTCRPGERFVAPTKANGVARLLDMELAAGSYVLEYGAGYIRFYTNHAAVVEAAKVITGATAANPVVITSVAHGFVNNDEVEIDDVVGMTQLNERRFLVTNKTDDTFELEDIGTGDINGTAYTAYSSGGTASRVYTLAVNSVAAELLNEPKVAQSPDTLYFAHTSYPPHKLTRTSDTSWAWTEIQFFDGPWLPQNTTATTITPSATALGSCTLTASAALFAATDVGRLVRIKNTAIWGFARITVFTDTTHVTATIESVFSSTSATTVWRLGEWSATTGYPAAVGFHSDRLCFGGAAVAPNRVDMSNTADYENFAPSAVDGSVGAANSVSVVLNASKRCAIRWLENEIHGLLVGTSNGEWVVRPSTTAEPLSPTNVEAKRSTTYGSANVQPVPAGEALLYLQRSGRKLRELAYTLQQDKFVAPDMTVLSEHITKGGITQLAYQQEPLSIVWGVRLDGTLVGFTYNREQDVLGWHRHTFGGFSDAAQVAAAKCESVAAIRAPSGDRDELWSSVQRYINGRVRRYVGFLEKSWERGDAQADALLLDSALTLNNTIAATLTPGAGATVTGSTDVVFTAGSSVFASTDVARRIHYDFTDAQGVLQRANAIITEYTSGTAVKATILYPWPTLTLIASAHWRLTVTSLSRLWHLEGQTLDVYADGATLPAVTVSLGVTTISYGSSIVSIGLPYNSDGQTLRIDAGSREGTATAKVRRINRIGFVLHDTLGIKIGPSFDKLTRKTFRTSSDPAGVAPPLFSGVKLYEWGGDYDLSGYICWRRDQPEPMTVLAVAPQVVVQD